MKESIYLPGLRFALIFALFSIPCLAFTQWVRKADGLKARSELAQTIVYNSKIYNFVGYSDAERTGERTSEVYDLATNKWTYIASVPVNTVKTHQGTLLIDKSIWQISGRVGKNPGPLTSSIWIYNITANTWSRGPEILDPATGKPLPIAGSGVVLLGRVIHIFGGFTPNACTNDQDKYHLTLDVDTWLNNKSLPPKWENKLAPLPMKRCHLSSLTLGGKIYALGGQLDHDCGSAKEVPYCHVYDPSNDSWTQLPSLPSPRSHAEGATFAVDGKIYMVGGQGSDGNSTTKISIFDPEANSGIGTWTENSSLVLPKTFEGLSSTIIGSTFFIAHGSINSSRNSQKTTYTRTIERNPVYKLGFPSVCLNLTDYSDSSIKGHTWLYTIDGTKNYTITSSDSWLEVSKNASGIANPNAVDIEVSANTSGLAPGNYTATITATGTGSGPDYAPATLCVSLSVQQTTQPLVYSLVVTSNGSGNVSKTPDMNSYTGGTNVTLNASPGQGQQFTGWSGDASGTANPLTIKMNANKSIIANFAPLPQYTLSVSQNGNGTVVKDPDQVSYTAGSAVSLTATPAANQQFTGWTGNASGIANPLSVIMNADKVITANFSERSAFAISNITSTTGRSYILGQLTTGTTFFSDRTYEVISFPAFLNNAPMIKTPNTDKSNKSTTLFSFNINQPATVYVVYDPRVKTLPAWLKSWQKTTEKVYIQDPVISYMELYSKTFVAGKVSLGGNLASPAAGALSNYFVVVQPQAMGRGVNYLNINEPVQSVTAADKYQSAAQKIKNAGVKVNLYPNPGTGNKVKIALRSHSANEVVSVTMHDITGKMIQSSTLFTDNNGTGNTELSLKGIIKGIYIIKTQGISINKQSKLLIN